MKNNDTTIYGLKSERLSIPTATLITNQHFYEIDSCNTYIWDSFVWVKVQDAINKVEEVRHFYNLL